MSDPFHKLKGSMKNSVFKDLTFSQERKEAVRETINRKGISPPLHSWKEETVLHVLIGLKQGGAQTGFEISTHLFQKNEHSFLKKEGQLYTLLHLLENKGILSSRWEEVNGDDERKYYSLTTKGKRQLAKASKENSSVKQAKSLRHLLEEVAP